MDAYPEANKSPLLVSGQTTSLGGAWWTDKLRNDVICVHYTCHVIRSVGLPDYLALLSEVSRYLEIRR